MKNKLIDIWPINFFAHTKEIPDESWKFILQMACILQMVPGWKNSTKLRVFASSKYENAQHIKQVWERRLKQLRIECEVVLAEWNDEILGAYEVNMINCEESLKQQYFANVNSFVKTYSRNSALLLLYLPAPSINRSENGLYLQHLTQMTDQFPPTAMIYGITEVTSDSL